MQEILNMNSLMRQLLTQLVSGIDSAELYEQVGESGNSPGWILGHLSVVNQLGVQMLGGTGPSAEAMQMFGPGSPGVPDPATRPGKEFLLQLEQSSAAQLREAIEGAPEQALNSPQPSQFLKERFPLVKDMLGHMLVSHLSLHVGQLSTWRRAKGMPSILQFGK